MVHVYGVFMEKVVCVAPECNADESIDEGSGIIELLSQVACKISIPSIQKHKTSYRNQEAYDIKYRELFFEHGISLYEFAHQG